MDVETRMVRTFFESEKYQYWLKFIESNGQPRVGISTFYAYKDHWNPDKKHFFMSLEEWKCFLEAVGQFDEDVKRGATLLRSTQISVSYKIFSIYSFAIIYNFFLN